MSTLKTFAVKSKQNMTYLETIQCLQIDNIELPDKLTGFLSNKKLCSPEQKEKCYNFWKLMILDFGLSQGTEKLKIKNTSICINIRIEKVF